ncbi:MAG: hypothetical protein ACRCZF_02795, partial [Gemmataceae bacterium]
KIKVTGLKENVERWRGQLRGLAAPFDTPSAALQKQLVESQNAFDEIAAKLAPLATEIETGSLATQSELDAIQKKLSDAETGHSRGKALPDWLSSTTKAYTEYMQLFLEAGQKATTARNLLLNMIRTEGKNLLKAIEALDTHGYDPGAQATSEFPKALKAQRTKLRDTLDTMRNIEKELASAVPPTEARVQELQKTLVELAKDIPDTTQVETFRGLALKVETEAQALRDQFMNRKKQLGIANDEAQWFLGTDDNGAANFISRSENRQLLTTKGMTPWSAELLNPNNTTDVGYNYAKHVFHYIDRDKVPKTVTMESLRKFDVGLFNQVQWQPTGQVKFMLQAGAYRQQYVPYGSENPQKIEAKRAEMKKALVPILNNLVKGLDLKESEVNITWKTAAGDELAVTMENTFDNHFRVSVLIPKQPPLGLMGQADSEYAVLLNDAKQLATGIAPVKTPLG